MATAPLIVFCRSVATLSLLPLVIVWFGAGELTKVFLIGYGCFWVMLSNVVAAVKFVDPALTRAARTMDVGPVEMFLRVALPAALPRIFAGARIALGVGFMVIVGAEMIGTIHGLGALIIQSAFNYRAPLLYAAIFASSSLALLQFGAVVLVEKRLIRWQG